MANSAKVMRMLRHKEDFTSFAPWVDDTVSWMVKTATTMTRAASRTVELKLHRGAPEGNLTAVRVLRASRILLFPEKLAQLWRMGFLRCFFGSGEYPDKFFFLSYNHYLSRRFSLRQRVSCAVDHYGHEWRSCGPRYHEAVYGSAEGLTLWKRTVHGTQYTLCLRATEDLRREGDLSILCFAGGTRVCRVSFSYVRGGLFGIDSPFTIFVTRNQSDRNAALQRFRADFKQNSPPYFCVAALCGIAMAHGIYQICLIQDEAQIAYQPCHAQSFKNSYSEFWRAFGANQWETRGIFTMTVPPELNPISTVKHKARAAARRQNWLEIMVNARQAILPHRVNSSPPPIDVEAATLIRAPALPSHPLRAPRNEIETTCLDS